MLLSNAQRAEIEAASLPDKKAVEYLLDYLANVRIEGNDDDDLAQETLLDYGVQGRALLVARLEDIAQHPEQYGSNIGYVFIFRAAASTQDQKALFWLQQIELMPHAKMAHYARQSRLTLERTLSNTPPIPQ